LARTSTHLNFARETESAFGFYRSVFGTEYLGEVRRYRDIPAEAGFPAPPADDLDLITHISLPILGGHVLIGTDAPESTGMTVEHGNGHYISLDPDTRTEADRLFAGLSTGGIVQAPMTDMFWGSYFGSIIDRFGVQWMIDCTAPV
jgi:PhnB protein